MDDREIQQWDKRLADQVRRGWDNYKHLRIDLTAARLDETLKIAGEFLYVYSSSGSAAAKIKLNRNTNDSLDLEKGVNIETVFIDVFITNDAQPGEWIDLVFGINFKYREKSGPFLSNNEIQIDWAGDPSVSIPFGNNATSDAFVLSANGSFAHIQIKADNDGAPAGGDVVDFFLLLTCGDPDGAVADEYDTIGHAIPLGRLDTNVEDPALRTVNCPMVKGGRLYAENASAGRAITVSACVLERTVS